MLPTDAKERKAIPVYSGFVCYFPDAIAEVAKVSKRGNDQHNPGKPLHWDRSKSGDELDAMFRHILDGAQPGTLDQKIEEAAARTWRSLADLQKLCESRDQEDWRDDTIWDEKLREALTPLAPKEPGVHGLMQDLRKVDDASSGVEDALVRAEERAVIDRITREQAE